MFFKRGELYELCLLQKAVEHHTQTRRTITGEELLPVYAFVSKTLEIFVDHHITKKRHLRELHSQEATHTCKTFNFTDNTLHESVNIVEETLDLKKGTLTAFIGILGALKSLQFH